MRLFPEFSRDRSLASRRKRRGVFWKPRRWVSQRFRSSEEERSQGRSPSIRSIFLFESLPGKGNEGRQIDLRKPIHWGNVRGRFDMERWSQVPSDRPSEFPEGISFGFLVGALENGFPLDTFPEGSVSMGDTGLHGSVPHGGTCLPFCRGMGGTFTPLGSLCRDLSPRPFLQRSRETVSDQVLGMRAKARSFACRKKV